MGGFLSVLPVVMLLSLGGALVPIALVGVGTTSHGAVGPTGTTVVAASGDWERLGMVLDIGPPGAYDGSRAINPSVLEDGATFRMWYRGFDGGRNRILSAASVDGRTWMRQGLVIDVGSPPYYFDSANGPSVVKDGSTYRMWFAGGFWTGPFGITGRIYHAESSDAVTWSLGGVALDVGPPGAWDGAMVAYPSVLLDSLGIYWMYYSGWDGVTNRIGVATSTDGLTFTRLGPDPILDLGPAGAWDGVRVDFPTVLEGSPWTMMYSGDDGAVVKIGRATSTDGVHWTRATDNPEFTPAAAGEWDGGDVFGAALLLSGSDRYMYYSGSDRVNGRIGLAREVKKVASGNVNCDPNTISLRSKGRWITCYLEPDPPVDASDIMALTVRLDSWLAPVLDAKQGFSWDPGGFLVDHDHDGFVERLLKFDRQLLSDRLTVGEHNFLVEGELADGRTFRIASETIRVIA